MRKQVVVYSLLGLLAYLLFLVWTFPADRAVALLRSQTPQLQMTGVTGTVWSGRATILQYQGQRLPRFKWQFQPLALFKAQLAFAIAFDGEGRTGSADVGLRPDGSVVVEDIDAHLPMADLATQLGIPISLNGMVEVALAELTVANDMVQSAQGTLHWREAAMTAPVAQKLGDFSAQLTTEAAGIKAQIRDEGGPLQLEGTVRLINDGSYQFSAKATVRDVQQTLLQQALQAAGRQEADGRVLLEYNGRL
jgi:general secretion pathway protein N